MPDGCGQGEAERRPARHAPVVWLFGLPSNGEREFLRDFGLDLRDVLTIGGEESIRRYATHADGTSVGEAVIAAAMARLAARMPAAPPGAVRQRQPVMAYQLAEAVVS